jgi:probable phosphoglycerate mutase
MTADLRLPTVYLARHGETAWSLTGQHTGLTDLPLTKQGEENARSLGRYLKPLQFDRVWCSPLLRARRTCELAGYSDHAELDPDLVEWNYGRYEGKTSAEIQRERPDWNIYLDGCPEGESVADVWARADRVARRVREANCHVLLFSSGHFLRMLAARWVEHQPIDAQIFYLDTATLSILGYHHALDQPVVRLWNGKSHLR